MQIELKAIPRDAFDRLAKALGETKGIGCVWIREYDSRLLSKIEFESRLPADQLKDELLRHIGNGFDLDRYGRHHLQFVPRPGVAVVSGSSVGATDVAAPAAISGGAGLPPWAWALVGAGGAAALSGVYLLGRRSRK